MPRGRVPLAPGTKRAALLELLILGKIIDIDYILAHIDTPRHMVHKMIEHLKCHYGFDIKLVGRNQWCRIN